MKLFTLLILSLLTFLFTSCGITSRKNEPIIEESVDPWTRKGIGEGQAVFGGSKE